MSGRPLVRLATFAALLGAAQIAAALFALSWAAPLGPSTARAQAPDESPLRVEADREEMSSDERLALTIRVEVEAGRPPVPVIPEFEDWEVVGSSTSSQLSIQGNRYLSVVTYDYELQPRRAGMLSIEPVRLEWQGRDYASDAIVVRVREGSVPPLGARPTPFPPGRPAGRPYFVEAVVDDTEPWVGQQVVYAFRFYQAQRLGRRATYNAPDFTGFYRKDAADQRRYTTRAEGRIYEVTELRTFLFPTAAGEVEIGPAALDLAGEDLPTETLALDVRPLPPGAPEGFEGAVGQYALTARVDSATVRVDEPLRLEVSVSGRGNLETLPDPAWPELDGWIAYDEGSTTNTRTGEAGLVGERRWTRLLIPQRPGATALPPIELPYFDPETESYEVAASDPISLVAAPIEGQEGAPAEAPRDAPATAAPTEPADAAEPEPSPLPEGPRALRPMVASDRSGLPSGVLRGLPWLLLLLPALLIGADVARRRARDAREARAAADVVGPLRARVRDHLADGRAGRVAPPLAAEQALDAALAALLGHPAGGLTRRARRAALQEAGADEARIAAEEALRDALDARRFAAAAPDPAGDKALLDRAEAQAEGWLALLEVRRAAEAEAAAGETRDE